ncbi:hypothetical protein BT67DRAFT_50169 [Trichocladium antarcticum]|uniref:Secreted protein n=1 Tax=Trichocladium antarcticum TaxID=1450529 RepID=A0AAN6UKJ8_9PEZI|nr:hypothetical protein BT67DRAFT_50169 [Trichocladium antarcticum]
MIAGLRLLPLCVLASCNKCGMVRSASRCSFRACCRCATCGGWNPGWNQRRGGGINCSCACLSLPPSRLALIGLVVIRNAATSPSQQASQVSTGGCWLMSVFACAAACGQLDGELACLNYDERRESWQRLPESPRRHCSLVQYLFKLYCRSIETARPSCSARSKKEPCWPSASLIFQGSH